MSSTHNPLQTWTENSGQAPVFEGEVNISTPAGEVQAVSNIAGAFHSRDPKTRLYARIMYGILVAPVVVGIGVAVVNVVIS